MSDDVVKIEVDGRELEARKGAMLIEATDAAGIYIPRFCYHKHLSVAANCRMCLVEVERAPKPMPACATPVVDGMKVSTRSPKATSAQHATMEFLLINHPLDCPICDQGGECELQDLAMGFGGDVSQFSERKRVVRDKNIGPLVQTDMTRCIHCTRCVRFGEEIAGLRELGATGRGEDMEIGTYVAKAMTSELSGNVIDLCPVGALTNKPYRYSARAWELQQRDGIAPHDALGSNLHFHVKGQTVKRVVPADNATVNETWISDRDRYSYLGMNHEARLTRPRIKRDGRWVDCDWDSAFAAVVEGLGSIAREDATSIAALASPSSTTEELYLLQKLLRGLGSQSIDHRLRQRDFSAQSIEPTYPAIPPLDVLETADAVLLIGAYPRHEQPLVNLRLRKAALRGGAIVVVDTLEQAFNYALTGQHVCKPSALVDCLSRVLADVAARKGATSPAALAAGSADVADGTPEFETSVARLAAAERPMVLVGATVEQHPQRSLLLELAAEIARVSGAQLGILAAGANAAGAWLAGAVPHRGPAGSVLATPGRTSAELLETPPRGCILLGFDPALDSGESRRLQAGLREAECVVALSAFESAALDSVADVLLPIAVFGENEGSFVNLNGTWQSFAAAVAPRGEARPAWKVLRVLGAQFGLGGFDAVKVDDVTSEIGALAAGLTPGSHGAWPPHDSAAAVGAAGQLEVVVEVPMYRVDQLVRHAPALQQMPQSGDDYVRVAAQTAADLGWAEGVRVDLVGADAQATAVLVIDDRVPPGACLVAGARPTLAEIAVQGSRIALLQASGNVAA